MCTFKNGKIYIFFSSHLHWLYARCSHYNHVYQIIFQTIWNEFFFTKIIFYVFLLNFRFNHRLSKVAFYRFLSSFLLKTLWRSQAIMMNWRPTSFVHLSVSCKLVHKLSKNEKKSWEPCLHLKFWYLNQWCKIDLQKLSLYINGEKLFLKSNLFPMVKLLSHTYS